MSHWRDRVMSPFPRGAVVGLMVAVSTFTADLANFVGHLGLPRALLLFGLAGASAAAVTVMALPGSLKKNS